MSGAGLLVTPYCRQLMASVLAISFVGVAMGALDTGTVKAAQLESIPEGKYYCVFVFLNIIIKGRLSRCQHKHRTPPL